MNRKSMTVIVIFGITIIASIWWYRVIKGSMKYESISELLIVLVVALIIASIISIIYLSKRKAKTK